MIGETILQMATPKKSNKQGFGKMILSRLTVAVCLLGSACSNPDPAANVPEVSSEVSSKAEQYDTQNTVAVESTNAKEASSNVEEDGNDPIEGPVDYATQDWPVNADRFNLSDVDAMQGVFGKVQLTDENSLDYASNTAVKYRFMDGNEPYLDIIDSQEYVEFGWYYANASDSNKEKQISIEHAKKVYAVAQGLMGDEGKQLVTSMLNGQIIKNEDIGGQRVALAKCEFYSCMLILEKDKEAGV